MQFRIGEVWLRAEMAEPLDDAISERIKRLVIENGRSKSFRRSSVARVLAIIVAE